MKIQKLFLMSGLIFLGLNAFAADPTTSILKVYGVALSQNADCSNAKVIGYNPAGVLKDFTAGATLGTGSIAAGTYNCVILYTDATLEFQSGSATGSCNTTTTYQRVLCTAANGCQYSQASPDSNDILVYGSDTASTAADSSDVANSPKVMIFISTGSTGNGQYAFLKPDSSNWNYGLPLTSPLVVSASGSASGTFVMDFRGKIDGSSITCDLLPPIIGFR